MVLEETKSIGADPGYMMTHALLLITYYNDGEF